MKERQHDIKTDFGLPQFYKFYTKKYGEIDRKTYSSIITEFNNNVIDSILNDNLIFQMPYLWFEILIKKVQRKPRIVNGKLINNVPIDFKTTNELWDKDPEAKEKKLLIRYTNSHTNNYVYRIMCKKFKSKTKNKGLYKFRPNREFKRLLCKRIKDPNKSNFDAFLLYKN